MARAGYLNLVQPQDRRSTAAGDSREAVKARRRLLDDGVGAGLIQAFAGIVAGLDLGEAPQVVDLGSGTGHLLVALAAVRPMATVGIDLSVFAAEHASRRHPELTWVVANADRRLPLPDASTSLVVSMHGRRNPAECARVLTPAGYLLAAVPASDDLSELRAGIHGAADARQRLPALVEEHEALFTVLRQKTVRERRPLGREQLLDLLRGTYRGARYRAAEPIEQLGELDVTLASDLVLFAKRSHAAQRSMTDR